jgi:hypothetical protein
MSKRKVHFEDTVVTPNGESLQVYNEALKVEGNRIKDVHLVGLKAKNKEKGKTDPYTYKEEALSASVSNYNGVDVNTNHNKSEYQNRDIADKIGYIDSPVFKEGKGIYGDVVLNEKHPLFEAVKWWAENKPSKLGMSHVAQVVYSESENAVTKVGKVFSVDIVSNASTTNGLFSEGVVGDKITELTDDDKIRTVARAVSDLVWESMYSMEKSLTAKEKALKLKSIYEDATLEVSKLFPVQESTSASTSTEGNDMKIEEVTLEMLKTSRKDIVSAIKEEAIEAEKVLDKKVQEAITGIPANLVTATFTKLVREAIEAGKDTTELLADRKAIAKEVPQTLKHESVETTPKAPGKKKCDKDSILAALGKK